MIGIFADINVIDLLNSVGWFSFIEYTEPTKILIYVF